MSWAENINTIKEIFPGHYQIILDFATINFVQYVLSIDYKYVWINNHHPNDSLNWQDYQVPLFNNKDNYTVAVRNLSYDMILPTAEFKSLLPKFSGSIQLVQLNIAPQYYLNDRIKGKTRYDLLKNECDYLFELDIPGATDYGTLISSNKAWLEALLSQENINWNDLP
ncbi:hypothetical protein [Mucilaginibacter sp.]|uniref:hypothetical protein n=1 Tax=Mucilaginibacter sp. TaxID=1882438 RepID=UPI0032662545